MRGSARRARRASGCSPCRPASAALSPSSRASSGDQTPAQSTNSSAADARRSLVRRRSIRSAARRASRARPCPMANSTPAASDSRCERGHEPAGRQVAVERESTRRRRSSMRMLGSSAAVSAALSTSRGDAEPRARTRPSLALLLEPVLGLAQHQQAAVSTRPNSLSQSAPTPRSTRGSQGAGRAAAAPRARRARRRARR